MGDVKVKRIQSIKTDAQNFVDRYLHLLKMASMPFILQQQLISTLLFLLLHILICILFDRIENDNQLQQAANEALDNAGDANNTEEGGSDGDSAAAIESAWIVKLRGLPWSVTTQDILDFLDGVEVSGGTNGVHLITYSRNSSRPNGEAFVVCATEESYNKAFEYNKKTMGHRYIESKFYLMLN